MVLCLVNCPAEVHSATIFALHNGKIFEIAGGVGGSPPHPLKFHPWVIARMASYNRPLQ